MIKYREENTGNLWVSECDIKKFFDCVNHEIVLENFYLLIRQNRLNIDDRAINLFISYLNSYSFNGHVYPKNKTDYFKSLNLDGCSFPWPDEDLYVNFYGQNNNFNQPIGVPQGGAISCFIANLIMHHVDMMVTSCATDNSLLYMRFCDDMIIVHPEKKVCSDALKRYEDAVFNQNLLIHEAKFVGPYSKDFWDQKIKSKKPYRWGPRNITGNVPWVSFVGYQVRYDGNTRIRKASLKKEIEKQKHEINEVIKALGQKTNKYHPNLSDIDINLTSRKSIKQQIHSAHSRLISMSVGRVSLYSKDKTFGMCWTNGFKSLNKNSIIESQLKQLDRFRNKHIFFLKKRLSHLEKKSNKVSKIKQVKFFGAPFSYHYYIHRIDKGKRSDIRVE